MPKKSRMPTMEDQVPSDETQGQSVDVANAQVSRGKMKSERSKKKSRQSERTNDSRRSEKSRRKSEKTKTKRRRRKQTKTEEDRQFAEYDKAKQKTERQESEYQAKLTEDNIEIERLRLEEMELAEKMKPNEVLRIPEDALQRILSTTIHGQDVSLLQDQIDRLNTIKEQEEEELDDDIYMVGKMLANPDLSDDRFIKTFDFHSSKNPGPSEFDKEYKFMEKNFKALSDMHKRGYDYFVEMKKLNSDLDLIKPYPISEELKREILNEYVYPFHIDTPYYYGTKDIRPPYNEKDAKKYEKSKKEWEEILESLYGDEPVPELVPLTLEEMGVRPEFSKPLTEEQKKEYKNYYLRKSDNAVLQLQMKKGVHPGSLEGTLKGLPESLEIIKDYYSGPTIIGCLEIQKQGLHQISKELNTHGSFADKHLSYCSDNTLLTEVYLRNFEKLPTELIMPVHETFNKVLDECSEPDNGAHWGMNRYLPPCIKTELLNILEKLGLYTKVPDFQEYGGKGERAVFITPTNSSFLLAQNFKRLKKNEQQLFSVGDMVTMNNWPREIKMIMKSGEELRGQGSDLSEIYQYDNGMDLLRLTLELLEEYYNLIVQGENNDNGAKFVRESKLFDIERTKRYIILIFMGLIGHRNDYVDRLMGLDSFYRERSATAYTEIVKHERGLPTLDTYDSELGRNTGPRVRVPLDLIDLALYKNELVELEWKDNLVSDMKKLYNYFKNKMRYSSTKLKYGGDYYDYFEGYYK